MVNDKYIKFIQLLQPLLFLASYPQNDYGLIATFGLSHAYKILFNLRGGQQWE
jgi:hypothetical protein